MIAVVIAAAAAGAFTAQAAGSTGSSVHACATSKGLLLLAGKKGKCAAGDHRVSIDEQGPRGATGPAGKSGVGATSALLNLTIINAATNSASTLKKVGTIAGYTVDVDCRSDGDGGSAISVLFQASSEATQPLYIHGQLGAGGNEGSGAGYGDNTAVDPSASYATGYNIVGEILQTGSTSQSQLYVIGNQFSPAYATANLLLSVGTSTATLDAYLYISETSDESYSAYCQANAQLTPSTTRTG